MSSFFEKLKKGMGIEAPSTDEPEEQAVEEKPKKTKKAATAKAAEPKRKKSSRPAEVEPEELKEPAEEETEETEDEIETPKELKIEAKAIEPELEEEVEIAKPVAKEPIAKNPRPLVKEASKTKEWQEVFDEPTGQLGIDVYQTATNLVIQSAIAGVRTENLEISLERDVVTIKGIREKPFQEDGDYFTQECYWGPFSRQVIMPVEVDPDRAEATMKEGILTIRIPKILREKKRTIKVRI